jgi:hypothetical protein
MAPVAGKAEEIARRDFALSAATRQSAAVDGIGQFVQASRRARRSAASMFPAVS